MLVRTQIQEVIGLRSTFNWRRLLFAGVTLAALLLASGARWRPL